MVRVPLSNIFNFGTKSGTRRKGKKKNLLLMSFEVPPFAPKHSGSVINPSSSVGGGVGSPSYSLLAESEALLRESDQPNPFLARPLFTATNLAKRKATPPHRPSSPLQTDGVEPVTTTIFPRVKVATFPALIVKAEHQLRADRQELMHQANTTMESTIGEMAHQLNPGVSLDEDDVEIMKSLHTAAVGLASGQSGVREATKRLMIVCREQQEEIDALARKQSESGVTTSEFVAKCHELEDRCRTTSLRVENCATQVNRIELEVSDALMESRSSMRRILTRIIKTTLLANSQAAVALSAASNRTLLKRYWGSWLKRGVGQKVAHQLLQKTLRGTMLVAFRGWSSTFLRRRRELHKRHKLLTSKTFKGVAAASMSKWLAYVQRKKSQRSAGESLLRSTVAGTQRLVLYKWRRFVAVTQQREALYSSLASLLYGCERSHARWRLAVWFRSHQRSKMQRKNVRLSSLLASNTERSFRSFVFRSWMRFALESSAKKHLAGKMAVNTRKYFVLRFYKRWEEFRRDRWIDRKIIARVAPLQASLDLAIATAARNGEIVHELLERQIALEAQLLQVGATKVSIRQLRPEAFRGSLIDLENADASPSKVVHHLAEDSGFGKHQRNASRSRGPSIHTEDNAAIDPQQSGHQVTLRSHGADGNVAVAPQPLASEPMSHLIQPADSLSQRAARATASVCSDEKQQGGRSSSSTTAAFHDPLQSLAQHYGVATPHIKRRALP